MIIDNHGYRQYSREEMLQLVQDWYREHGKIVIRDKEFNKTTTNKIKR